MKTIVSQGDKLYSQPIALSETIQSMQVMFIFVELYFIYFIFIQNKKYNSTQVWSFSLFNTK